MKRFLLLGNLLLFFYVIPQAQTVRPNIIYMMADDMGYADLSCYGRKDYQTPNLDKLAAQGVKFMNAYAAAPVCTPTRVAFMTGRYPAKTPVGLREPLDWTTSDSLIGLTPDYTSIATLMKKSGYETYLVGKWHLGFLPQFSPKANGYDYFLGFHAGGIDYVSHTDPLGKPDLFENDEPVKRDGYLTDIWMNKAIDIINKPHPKPFFLTIMFNAPHWPWQGPGDSAYAYNTDWKLKGTAAIYARMMKSLDDAVGTILKAIDEKGLAKNTIVIFTSDNGGERFSDNGIYKAGKMNLWEGGIREPAFIRWPGKIKPNSVSNQVVTTMDWTASILAAAGAHSDPKFPLDGIVMWPYCFDPAKTISRTLFWRISQRQQHKAMRDGNWKYMRDEKGVEYLFDLLNDPAEKNDLKEKENKIFEALKNKYSAWEKTVLEPIEKK